MESALGEAEKGAFRRALVRILKKRTGRRGGAIAPGTGSGRERRREAAVRAAAGWHVQAEQRTLRYRTARRDGDVAGVRHRVRRTLTCPFTRRSPSRTGDELRERGNLPGRLHDREAEASSISAVSTAYYAMFHCLAASAADLFIGTVRSPAWHRTYRALEHRQARSACLQGKIMREFPAEIRDFAEAFVALQKARQEADYALNTDTYQDSDVLGYIASAERARFEQAVARRGFVAHVLFRQRAS